MDIDPYGSSWEIVEAFFNGCGRTASNILVIVVNDGLLQKIRMGGLIPESVQPIIDRYGLRHVQDNYRDVCRDLLAHYSQAAGYKIVKWTSYNCGRVLAMTHFAARLERA